MTVDPFVALMRRYCIDYTSRQDLSVCDDIMEPGYTLHMGGHHVTGRDDQYKPAARKQFDQFPGLGLTVNEIVCSGDRVAMRFTEHGASIRHGNARAAWGGIGLYRWNGHKLVENFVEQDYLARKRQLDSGLPDSVDAPAVAPWDTVAVPPDPNAENTVRTWIAGGLSNWASAVTVDDSRSTGVVDLLFEVDHTELDDLFSAGPNVAFHGVQRGISLDGESSEMHIVGIVQVTEGRITAGNVIRDRLGLAKREQNSRKLLQHK